MIRRLGLAVSDTAGHVHPALAIAEAFAAVAGDLDVRFFGSADGAASSIVSRAGHVLHVVPGSRVARARPLEVAGALARAAIGIGQARRALAADGIQFVIGTGGYGSFSVVLAASLLRLPVAIVEPNADAGIANRWLGRVAQRVYLAFPEAARHFDTRTVRVTGVPVRRGALPPSGFVRERPRLGLTRLLIVSGTRGDSFFLERAAELAAELGARSCPVDVIHQVSDEHASSVQHAYRTRGIAARTTPFIDDIGAAMRDSDFIVARAGASTIAEVALARVPALLVPLNDAAADHQAANARAVAKRGAAVWIREDDWTPGRAAGTIAALLRDDVRWRSTVAALAQLARPDAADRIVRDCTDLSEGRG